MRLPPASNSYHSRNQTAITHIYHTSSDASAPEIINTPLTEATKYRYQLIYAIGRKLLLHSNNIKILAFISSFPLHSAEVSHIVHFRSILA